MDNEIYLKQFLKETEYCDFKHPEIQKLAKSFLEKYQDKNELAIALFKFARDEIKYKIGPWDKKASTVLSERSGMCTSCTNLLVALFRSVGIPAGYCIYKVKGGESFGHILSHFIKRALIKKPSVHVICQVYINNKWTKCDPATDKELSDKTKHIAHITDLIEWNGKEDAVHSIDRHDIIDIRGPLANIDFQLKKRPRYVVKNYIFYIGNLYVHFLRKEGPSIRTYDELEKKFRKWLRRNYTYRYYSYELIYFFYKLYYDLKYIFNRQWKDFKRELRKSL